MSYTDFDLSLYLVTDQPLWVPSATMVQLRIKTGSTADFVREALAYKKLLAGRHIPLIINDRVDVALAVDAAGVHLGQSDMPYPMARKLLGKDKIIGLSVENLAQVEMANSHDVDYIGISPVFATPTKTDTATPFGLDGLREAVRLSRHRTVAIGGMNLRTVKPVMETGVEGIAVVSAITQADDPEQAASELLHYIKHR